MTKEELFIFDILTRPAPELSEAERADVKKVAKALLNRLKELLVLNWRQKPTARSQLKLAIEDVLDTLPEAYDLPLYAQKCSALFEACLRELFRAGHGCICYYDLNMSSLRSMRIGLHTRSQAGSFIP